MHVHGPNVAMLSKHMRSKMAAVLGSHSKLPGYFTGAQSRANPVVASFEKELGYFAASIRRAERKAPTAESKQKL